jgi:hypothetical protein
MQCELFINISYRDQLSVSVAEKTGYFISIQFLTCHNYDNIIKVGSIEILVWYPNTAISRIYISSVNICVKVYIFKQLVIMGSVLLIM